MPQLAGDQTAWQCPHCEAVSYSPDDLRYHYCGRCHHFCDDVDGVTPLIVLSTGRVGGKGVLTTGSWEEAFAEGYERLRGGATEVTIRRFAYGG